jgi:hypothetical protein
MDKIPLSGEWRRALEMLVNAGERRGMTEGVLRARGFAPEMVKSLVACGLAAARAIAVPGDFDSMGFPKG